MTVSRTQKGRHKSITEFQLSEGQITSVNIQSGQPTANLPSIDSKGNIELDANNQSVEKTPTSGPHVEIGISEDDLTGQFDRLEEELSLSETEKRVTEAAIYELADSKIEKHGLKVSQEMRDAIANVLVSTFIQEEKQLDEQ
jgi:hypothetical protein